MRGAITSETDSETDTLIGQNRPQKQATASKACGMEDRWSVRWGWRRVFQSYTDSQYALHLGARAAKQAEEVRAYLPLRVSWHATLGLWRKHCPLLFHFGRKQNPIGRKQKVPKVPGKKKLDRSTPKCSGECLTRKGNAGQHFQALGKDPAPKGRCAYADCRGTRSKAWSRVPRMKPKQSRIISMTEGTARSSFEARHTVDVDGYKLALLQDEERTQKCTEALGKG